jgi:hypothetical protein
MVVQRNITIKDAAVLQDGFISTTGLIIQSSLKCPS